jgi:hypothetical protein
MRGERDGSNERQEGPPGTTTEAGELPSPGMVTDDMRTAVAETLTEVVHQTDTDRLENFWSNDSWLDGSRYI